MIDVLPLETAIRLHKGQTATEQYGVNALTANLTRIVQSSSSLTIIIWITFEDWDTLVKRINYRINLLHLELMSDNSCSSDEFYDAFDDHEGFSQRDNEDKRPDKNAIMSFVKKLSTIKIINEAIESEEEKQITTEGNESQEEYKEGEKTRVSHSNGHSNDPHESRTSQFRSLPLNRANNIAGNFFATTKSTALPYRGSLSGDEEIKDSPREDLKYSKTSITRNTVFESNTPTTSKRKLKRTDTVKIKLHRKSNAIFNGIVPAQEIKCGSEAIWIMKFSWCTKYFAVGGKDKVLKIYKVHEVDMTNGNKNYDLLQLFEKEPYKEFKGHTLDILDISWSSSNEGSNLILTASFDLKVMLWDIHSMNTTTPLAIYDHPEIVTSVSFLPESKNTFASGSLDKFIRIWNIEKNKVIETQQTQDHITSLKYSPSGSVLLAGLYRGQCIVYQFDAKKKLTYLSRVDCKNRRGKFSKGKKITGFHFLSDFQVLITTNDSRLRLLDLRDYKQISKFKGHTNESLQISATMSDDLEHIICGSEDGSTYVWNCRSKSLKDLTPRQKASGKSDKINSYESFMPFKKKTAVTYAMFVPTEVFNNCLDKYRVKADDKLLSHVIIVAGINGVLKVFNNEFYI